MFLNKDGFSFVELLIVISIMTILATIGIASYTNVQQGGRDGRRKADMQLIRGALENYRENNNAYPTPVVASNGLPFGTGALTDAAGNVYLQTVPQDPLSARKYYYTLNGADYILASRMEGTSACTVAPTPGADTCGTGMVCNLCYGSYGQK
ncbi:MAG: prepilin-type N-terminal cleavage/methylation domain-containing protein [Microgenomates group bacterium]